MNWIDSLERKFGRYAIPGLVRIIVALNAIVFIIYKIEPAFVYSLVLVPQLVLQGQVWRLVTYLFIPDVGGSPAYDTLFVILYLWFMWFIGQGLEDAMGTFKLNLFYLIGMIGTTVAALFFGGDYSSAMLNSTLFFAFARFYPDLQIYVMLVLPVKVRWMAWVLGALLLYGFVKEGASYRIAVIVAFSNYLIFFGPEIWREAGHRTEVAQRRRRFVKAAPAEDEALHRCKVCGRTEITNPTLEFRVAADGNDYCVEHLPKKG